MGKAKNTTSKTTIVNKTPPEEIERVRNEIMKLFQTHDPTKIDRLDAIMDKFQNKESLLLEKMIQRYNNTSNTTTSSTTTKKTRSELALERHKERMAAQKQKKI